MSEKAILSRLNEQQQEAVRVVDGPLLVLAGAGSGKTRVLTHRIAYLIQEKGVDPGAVLAMTFTNKAAAEMRERVQALLSRGTRGMWIGTFHSLCARLLRTEAESLGLPSSFAIYDESDQLALLRRVIRDEEISDHQFPPGAVRSRISREKSALVDPEAFARQAGTFYEQQLARIYRQYQNALRANHALDFDDLLMQAVVLLRDSPEVLARYEGRFQHILIDEYQDTNRPQYLLAEMLAKNHRNICVVGDDDQSIYAWRGADLRNILDFERDYPDARLVRLERNYRSTQVILDAGNALIRNNAGRKGKELWTDRDGGEKIRLLRCADEREEAQRVAGAMQDLCRQGNGVHGDMAVLYRTNAQSRAIEEGLRNEGIPYIVVGGVRFYERKEVKDILAYLRLIVNPRDSVSLGRVINTPRRGIGSTSLSRLDDFAMREGLTPYEALGRLNEVEGLTARSKGAMGRFFKLMEQLRGSLGVLPADELAAAVVDRTEYLGEFEELPPVEAESRRANVKELLAGIQEYTERSEDVSLEAFLAEVSLITDVDMWDTGSAGVTLMTLHSAKGLEFPVVFICGLEDGLLPIVRRGDSDSETEVEEERRLFYVGITRAMERLFLTHALQRRRYGGSEPATASRFLNEVPEDLIDSGFRITEGESPVKQRPAPVPVTTDEDPIPMGVGRWVEHPTLGRGQVQERTGRGESTKLTIRFQSGITRKVVVRYADLKPG